MYIIITQLLGTMEYLTPIHIKSHFLLTFPPTIF